MSLTRRKITIQLVPLLDLMLVVLFLQFMELNEKSRTEEARASQAVADTQQERVQLHAERNALAEQRHVAELTVEKAFDQRDLVGQLASELFNLPDDTIKQLLKQRFADDPPTDENIALMQQEFHRLRGQHGQEVLKHLLTFHEIRKRCDVWQVYVDRDVTTLNANGEETSFRAETQQAFTAQLFACYRKAPQSKGLVLIVLTWGAPRLNVYHAAMKGFPEAVLKMQADSKDRTRFEYAILGFDPQRTSRPK